MAVRVYNDEGRYLRRQVELKFSFLIPSTPTNAPTVVRDGQGAQVASVSAIASGVQTVTFKTADASPGLVLPRQLSWGSVSLSAAASGAVLTRADLVTGGYDPAARTLQIVYRDSDDGAVAASPAAGTWVFVTIQGPDVDQFKDAA